MSGVEPLSRASFSSGAADDLPERGKGSAIVDEEASASLFFDVDGTLVWADRDKLSKGGEFLDMMPAPGVYRAFGELRARGHRTYLCTGRPLSMVSDRLLDLGFDGVISAAGSCVSLGGKIVHETLIDAELSAELVPLLFEAGITAMLESRETPVVVSTTLDEVPAFSTIPVAHSFEEVLNIAPELKFCKITQPSIVDAPSMMENDALRMLIERNFDVCDMGLANEYSQKGVTKATGIAKVLELEGRDLANTFAFGDSENDLPMFGAVETSVAMGNAMPVLKERADYVTTHAKDDGIPHALRHFGLI